MSQSSLATGVRTDRVLASGVEATKPGITRLVTITALVGFALSALSRTGVSAGALAITSLGTLVGTALCAAGANALNQWLEHPLDARMDRTAARPIPSGRLSPASVAWIGLLLILTGVGVLWLMCGAVPASLGLACAIVYVFLYTPLKTRTVWSTLVGTIPGALPPWIGWTAASTQDGLAPLLEPGGWSLVLLMTVWQLPHFMAIAWMYREDYARGGMRMLPVIDPAGTRTAAVVLITGVMLIGASVVPFWAAPGLAGWAYLGVASVSGLVFVALCLKLAVRRTDQAARRVFVASIVHLPILLLVLVGEAAVRVLAL